MTAGKTIATLAVFLTAWFGISSGTAYGQSKLPLPTPSVKVKLPSPSVALPTPPPVLPSPPNILPPPPTPPPSNNVGNAVTRVVQGVQNSASGTRRSGSNSSNSSGPGRTQNGKAPGNVAGQNAAAVQPAPAPAQVARDQVQPLAATSAGPARAMSILAAVLLFGNPSAQIPLLPAPVAGIVRLALLAAPGGLEAFMSTNALQGLTLEENLIILALMLLAMLAVTRLLLDVRSRTQLRRALAPAYPPVLLAANGRAWRGAKVAYNDMTGVLRRLSTVNAVQKGIEAARRSRDSRLVVAFIDVNHSTGRDRKTWPAETETIAHGLAVSLRRQDTVFRYGGDELVCLMPRIDQPHAEKLLTEMRRRMQVGGLDFDVSLEPLRDGDDAGALISRAETAAATATNGHGSNGN